jgi:hypothetical protein
MLFIYILPDLIPDLVISLLPDWPVDLLRDLPQDFIHDLPPDLLLELLLGSLLNFPQLVTYAFHLHPP